MIDWDDIVGLLTITMVVFTMIGLIFWGVISLNRYQCNTYMQVTGVETKYDFPAGCFLKDGDTWMSWDEYKYRNVAKVGLTGE